MVQCITVFFRSSYLFAFASDDHDRHGGCDGGNSTMTPKKKTKQTIDFGFAAAAAAADVELFHPVVRQCRWSLMLVTSNEAVWDCCLNLDSLPSLVGYYGYLNCHRHQCQLDDSHNSDDNHNPHNDDAENLKRLLLQLEDVA